MLRSYFTSASSFSPYAKPGVWQTYPNMVCNNSRPLVCTLPLHTRALFYVPVFYSEGPETEQEKGSSEDMLNASEVHMLTTKSQSKEMSSKQTWV